MKTVRMTTTLVYYDGPIVFEARDVIGGNYIGMAVELADGTASYLIAGVSPEMLRQFRGGSIDLLTLLTDREDATWYMARPDDQDRARFSLRLQDAPLVESGFLPDPGFLLHEKQVVEEVLLWARERKHLVYEFAVEPPEAASEHQVSVDTLAGLLVLIQKIVKQAFNRAVRDFSPVERLGLDRENAPKLNVLVPAATGSFRVLLGVAKEPSDMFNHSDVTMGLALVDELFKSVGNPKAAAEIAKKYRGHLAGSYLRLFRYLQEKRTGLRYAYAEPGDDAPKQFSVTERQAGQLAELLSGIAGLETESVVLVGVLDKVHRKQGTWGLITPEGFISGVSDSNSRRLTQVTIGLKYKFECIEKTEIAEITDTERKTFILVTFEEVSGS